MFILIQRTTYSPYRTFPSVQRPVYYNQGSPLITNPGYIYSPYAITSPYQNYGNYGAYQNPNYNVYNPYPSYPSYSNYAYNPLYNGNYYGNYGNGNYGNYGNGNYCGNYGNGNYYGNYGNGNYYGNYGNGNYYGNYGNGNYYGNYGNGYNGYGGTTCYLSPLATFTSSLITNPIRDTGVAQAQACAPQPYCCPPTYIVNNYYNTPRQSFSHVNSPVTSVPFMGLGGDHDRQPNQGPTFPPFTS